MTYTLRDTSYVSPYSKEHCTFLLLLLSCVGWIIRCYSNNNVFCSVILLGDSGVGKTALLNCFTHKKFLVNTTLTVGVDYVFKDVHIGKDIIKAKIADTGKFT